MKFINGGVCSAKGFMANGIHCGIRKNKSKRKVLFWRFCAFLNKNFINSIDFLIILLYNYNILTKGETYGRKNLLLR